MTVSATPLPSRSTRSDRVSQGLCEIVGKDALNDAWRDTIFAFEIYITNRLVFDQWWCTG